MKITLTNWRNQMKVSKLIELLKTENQDAEIFAYLGAEQGYKIVDIGQEGGAVIG